MTRERPTKVTQIFLSPLESPICPMKHRPVSSLRITSFFPITVFGAEDLCPGEILRKERLRGLCVFVQTRPLSWRHARNAQAPLRGLLTLALGKSWPGPGSQGGGKGCADRDQMGSCHLRPRFLADVSFIDAFRGRMAALLRGFALGLRKLTVVGHRKNRSRYEEWAGLVENGTERFLS